MREILSQYFETARTVIARYGGTVEKFIGDAVMAVWGAPDGDGGRRRSARCAPGWISWTPWPRWAPRSARKGWRCAAGVVTGEVAVTLGAVGQGMVAGDAVNTAARVQTAAGPGQVWVDEATRRLAGAAIGFSAPRVSTR